MSLGKELANMRQDYGRDQLDESRIQANPFLQFETWFSEAQDSDVAEPNAMVLATAHAGRPSQRVVLLKGFGEEGLMFFTNYQSRKAQEIQDNPLASVCFFWDRIERQVRIEGRIEKVSEAESEAYFQSRGRGSRIGAWASPQSQEIAHREMLENRVQEMEQKFEGQDNFPKPAHWGGYRLVPDYFEFWQGRKSRLHDRIFYRKNGQTWDIGRLAP